MAFNLIWIEPSFAARRLKSSGGRSLHSDKASSKLPEAVNWTICNTKLSTEFYSVEQNQNSLPAICIGIQKQVTNQKAVNHSTTLAIPGLQGEQGRGHELNYPKQVSWNHCSGKGDEHFEEQLSVSKNKELGEIESVKRNHINPNPLDKKRTMKLFQTDNYLHKSGQQSYSIRLLNHNFQRSLRPANPTFGKKLPILVHKNPNVLLKNTSTKQMSNSSSNLRKHAVRNTKIETNIMCVFG